MVSGGISCIKYLLFCLNLLFAISGIAILTVGAICYVSYSGFSDLAYTSDLSLPLVLIGIGIIIFVIAFFGCCGAVKENNCMIITFSVLLGVIFALEVGIGILGYISRAEVTSMIDTNLENKFNSTMYKYYTNTAIAKSWDSVQHELQCCGTRGPQDWNKINHNNSLPHTCCPDTQNDGTCTLDSPNIFNDSCLQKFKDSLVKYASVMGAIGLGIAAFQLLGVIFACVLARNIRREYETV